MPIYEYQCPKCKKTIEIIQKVNDPPPMCHGKMKKLISKSTFHLKGSGWYKTDYQEKGKPNGDRKN